MNDCIVNGEPGQHEWDRYNRRCNRCGKTLRDFMMECGFQPRLVAVHVSADGMDRIAPKFLTTTPPGECPVLYAGGPKVHVNPALTGDQRIFEYSDGRLEPNGFKEVNH